MGAEVLGCWGMGCQGVRVLGCRGMECMGCSKTERVGQGARVQEAGCMGVGFWGAGCCSAWVL